MVVAAAGKLVDEAHEVGCVFGQQRSPLAGAKRQQFVIGEAAELCAGLDGDHVVAALT
jgi:hypothetical protein